VRSADPHTAPPASEGALSPAAFFWESLWPDTFYRAALLVIVAFSGVAFWLAAKILHPNVPLGVLAMLRNGGGESGDVQVYPAITSFLNVGEGIVYEALGSGIRSTPFVTLLPHGVLYALLGTSGLVVADVLFKLLYYASLCALLKTVGLRVPGVTESISALVTANGHALISFIAKTLWGKDWSLFLGGMRIPRPFVTDSILFGALALILLPFLVGTCAMKRSSWIALGALLGVLMQWDPYLFLPLALVLGVGCVYWLLTVLRNRTQATELIGSWILMATTLVLVASPYVMQRLTERPEIPVRLGLFPVSRTAPIVSVRGLPFFAIATALVAATVGILLTTSARERARRLRPLLALWIVSALAVLALPISCIVLGRAAQTYHAGITVRTMASLLIIVCVGHVFEVVIVGASRLHRPRAPEFVRAAAGTAKILVCSLCIGFTVSTAWTQAAARPEADFLRLATALSERRQPEWRVIGTLDPQVSWWWTSFAGGNAYVPDATLTTVPDAELEQRLAAFCREIGMSRDEFRTEILKWETMARWLGGLKYQAFRTYTPVPLEDYPEAERARIRATAADDCWGLTMPNSAVVRLLRLFDETAPAADLPQRLDLIVIRQDASTQHLAPRPERYDLIYADDTYRVWDRKGAP
jgi:hypothetical protein